MKFVAVLTAAVWLSLHAQVDSVFYIEIAGDKDPAEQATPNESALQPQPDLEENDGGSCRSLRTPGKKPLKGGMYMCEHVNTNKEPYTMKCKEPTATAKSEINYNANFFVVSRPQIIEGYTLSIDGEQLKSLPDVMMVGFSVTGSKDYPMFASDRSCYTKQEIVNADSFRNFLPSDDQQRNQLTNFFCCTNPQSCIFKNPNYAIDNYFPVIRDILQKCINEDKKPPPSKKELKQWKSQKGDQPAPAASGKLPKSKSFVNGLLNRWNVRKALKPVGSMKGFTYIGNVLSRTGSGKSYASDSESENGNPSPNRSGSNSPSRSNPQSRSSSPDRQLKVRGDDPSRDLMEQYEAAGRDLDDVMRIMLNRLIDPCVLMEKIKANDESRRKVLKDTCQTYCEFLGVATGRMTSKGTLKLVIDYIRSKPKHLVTCKKFDHGECVKKDQSKNHFCKCHKIDNKGRLDSGRRMVLCDNHLRNFLTPISKCK